MLKECSDCTTEGVTGLCDYNYNWKHEASLGSTQLWVLRNKCQSIVYWNYPGYTEFASCSLYLLSDTHSPPDDLLKSSRVRTHMSVALDNLQSFPASPLVKTHVNVLMNPCEKTAGDYQEDSLWHFHHTTDEYLNWKSKKRTCMQRTGWKTGVIEDTDKEQKPKRSED